MKAVDQPTMLKVFAIIILLGIITGVAAFQAFPEFFYGQFLIPAA
ncbi:hypothetical protein [Mesorhizobium australicum]